MTFNLIDLIEVVVFISGALTVFFRVSNKLELHQHRISELEDWKWNYEKKLENTIVEIQRDLSSIREMLAKFQGGEETKKV